MTIVRRGKKEMDNNRKGFTLVELLAVIVILAILMVSAGAGVMSVMNNSKINSFRNEVLTAIDSANRMYSEVSTLGDASLLKTSSDNAYSGMCVTLSGLVNNGFLEKDLTNYGGVVLIEVPYDGGKTLYNVWMHNNQYGVDGLEKDFVSKAKFKKDNNTTGTFATSGYTYSGDTAVATPSTSTGAGNGIGIVTRIEGIKEIVKLAQGAEINLQSVDKTPTLHSIASARGGAGSGRTYTSIKCINAKLS